jgi:uncharacterized protein (TIGR02145 family)
MKTNIIKKTNILCVLALLLSTITFAQVGIGTTNPHASSALDITSTDKGFLSPRMTTADRNVINSGVPAEGLTIYNTDINCLQWWNGSAWFNACDGTSTGIIPTNATCTTATISATSCATVTGATLNDDAGTPDGTEYDWTGATGNMTGGTTGALVEIGGQCWFRRNSIVQPTAPCADPINTGCNTWLNTSPGDIGSWGYYNTTTTNGTAGWGTTEPAIGEGLLYQWSAAMNGVTTERAQGVCPAGWHVPSDCEWMYLENTLGMSVTDQQGTGFRNSGSVGSKRRALTLGGTNSSGFTALLAGLRSINGSFFNRGTFGFWWSSSESSATDAHYRYLRSSQVGVNRNSVNKARGFSVRCLKD